MTTGRAYYNENDPRAAAWLRELIARRVIAEGEVDTRSILDVEPADLAGFRQCHFFAGIGGWSYALRLAGWPDTREVWTGSCPCQPFSMAGKRAGTADPRHLWPAWFRLIEQRRPATVFGEQVASADGLYWLDLVCADLEACGYAVGAVDLPAASAGAPHGRPRLWIVADDHGRGRGRIEAARLHERRPAARGGEAPTGDAEGARGDDAHGCGDAGRTFWSDCEWVPCRDGKVRPIKSGLRVLAHGVPAHVGRLRGYGNAIVPQVAALIIGAYLEEGAVPHAAR